MSFQVARGEAFGIIGANGAGKSTVLKLLTGIMRPTTGRITVRGRLSALIEVGAGFHPDLSGRENIYLNGTILGMSRDEIRRRFDAIVAFAGLEEFLDTPVKRYSSGMYARLGFAVAAHVEPDVLIVDEVLSVGDFAFQRRCVERMTAIIRGGATVVFVSHNLRAVADLCGRALLLERGRAIALGPSDEVLRTYLARFATARTPRRDDVRITRVALTAADGTRAHFRSGETATLEVRLESDAHLERLAAVVQIKDADFYGVFDTSTERLGAPPFAMAPGETRTCAFTLDLHLAPGTYHVSAWIYRYDTQTEYDHWDCAQTVFVSADRDVRGVANLYPRAAVGPARPRHGMAGGPA